jgi:hypothetical protein
MKDLTSLAYMVGLLSSLVAPAFHMKHLYLLMVYVHHSITSVEPQTVSHKSISSIYAGG